MKYGIIARRIASMTLLGHALISPAVAQETQDRLKDCRVIYDAMSRLFCYDSVVDTMTMGAPSSVPQPGAAARAPILTPPASMSSAPVTQPVQTPPPTRAPTSAPMAAVPRPVPPAPTAPVTPPPAAAPAPVTTASSLPPPTPRFGEDNLPADRRPQPERDEPDQMRARIANVAVDPYGDAVMTLDNGQVWKQTEGRAYRVKNGTEIVIKQGALGAYFLSAKDSSRTVKVKRVQ